MRFRYALSGFRDIHLASHSDFNRRFHLGGPDRAAIEALFTDPLVLFLESHPDYHVESNGQGLLILKKERLLGIQEIKRMIFFGRQLQTLIQPVQGGQ
jgi:hypothetical protein